MTQMANPLTERRTAMSTVGTFWQFLRYSVGKKPRAMMVRKLPDGTGEMVEFCVPGWERFRGLCLYYRARGFR